MIAGHIGAAAGAKRWAPNVPFWALLVASFLIDLITFTLIAFGIEKIEEIPGTGGGYGNYQYQVDWSHSFFGTLILCLVVLIVAARFWGARNAFILSCVVFSHWFLDSIVHRPDMPIAPGNAGNLPRVGLGMWDFPVFTLVLELLIVLGGAYLWYSMPEKRRNVTKFAAAAAVIGTIVLISDFTL